MSEEVKLLEELRPIGGGYYVSNTGRIIGKKGRELRPFINHKGYAQVDLRRCRRGKLVHRIVAQAFCDNQDPLACDQVDHINGVRLDNRAANLRWVNAKTNINAKYELRERLGLPRLSPSEEEQVKKARAKAAAKCSRPTMIQGKVFSSLSEAARHLSTNPGSLLHALKRGHYKGIPVAYA